MDQPSLLQPNFEKVDIDHLKSDLPHWKQWLSNAAAEEWDRFLDEDLPVLSNPSPSTWQLELLADATSSDIPVHQSHEHDQLLLEMFESERREPQVRIHFSGGTNLHTLLQYS